MPSYLSFYLDPMYSRSHLIFQCCLQRRIWKTFFAFCVFFFPFFYSSCRYVTKQNHHLRVPNEDRIKMRIRSRNIIRCFPSKLRPVSRDIKTKSNIEACSLWVEKKSLQHQQENAKLRTEYSGVSAGEMWTTSNSFT